MKKTAALLPLLLLAACATSGGGSIPAPSREVYDRYKAALEWTAERYHETMAEAGRAYAAGLLSDEGRETVLRLGQVAYDALEATRAALRAYLVSGRLADLAPRFTPETAGSARLVLREVLDLTRKLEELRSEP